MCVGNPMYHWCHLELRKYFGYQGVLNGDTAEEVWNPVSYTHLDVYKRQGIDIWANFGTHYFLERREIGMFNIGKDSTCLLYTSRDRRLCNAPGPGLSS